MSQKEELLIEPEQAEHLGCHGHQVVFQLIDWICCPMEKLSIVEYLRVTEMFISHYWYCFDNIGYTFLILLRVS